MEPNGYFDACFFAFRRSSIFAKKLQSREIRRRLFAWNGPVSRGRFGAYVHKILLWWWMQQQKLRLFVTRKCVWFQEIEIPEWPKFYLLRKFITFITLSLSWYQYAKFKSNNKFLTKHLLEQHGGETLYIWIAAIPE